jgi:hypothetical protein
VQAPAALINVVERFDVSGEEEGLIERAELVREGLTLVSEIPVCEGKSSGAA